MKKKLNYKINLLPTNLIASGRQRACYQHPDDDELCIKIHLKGRDDKETLREVRYYKRLYRKGEQATHFSLLWHSRNQSWARLRVSIN